LKIKCLSFILLALLFRSFAFSQEIKIEASNKSLSQILVDLRDNYDVDFSFDDTKLSKYKISISKSFVSIDETLNFLLKDLPFKYEKQTGVYIIFSTKSDDEIENEKPVVYCISGRIMEYNTREFLPYSLILVNAHNILSDQNGNFKYSSTKDSIFNIKVSNLGYLIQDTIIYAGKSNLNIYLKPADLVLSEIRVSDNLIESFSNAGNEPATIKLNHKVTKYLPGSSDNSVFNLLRLQPGVLASGEQTNDVIIWGAYAGQSRVIFDGFTVFGLKNFNDNISAINPLITKSIRVKKAGYDASYGDCVGGIVDITGKEGNLRKLHFEIGLNNFTMNSLLEIPILRKSSLLLAYRQTYYNLYKNGSQLFSKADSIGKTDLSDIYVYPDYTFRDFNLKYSIKTDKSLFYISALNSDDHFAYSFDKSQQYHKIIKNTSEENHQTGAAAFWQRNMTNKLNTSMIVSYSELSSGLNDSYDVLRLITNKLVNKKDLRIKNEIIETKAKLQTVYQSNKNQLFNIDLQAINHNSQFTEDSADVNLSNTNFSNTYYTVGIKDIISLAGKNLDIGIRTSYLPQINKVYPEPRIAFSQSINNRFRYNLACGIYRQFLVKSSIVDDLGNYRYFWAIADEENIPVLKGYHFVGGFSYNTENVNFNIDAFYKTTEGLTRYMRISALGKEDIFFGYGRSYGLDFYAKYNFSKHTIWLSYTLSKSEEHFSYFKTRDYLYSPQDQRHELKLATIVNLSPFYLSANYVFGSGFLEKPYQQVYLTNRIPYNRVDVSATFRFPKNKELGECGISILNLLNTENKKYSNFERIPISQLGSANIYYEAVPFTPTIFLKLTL